MNDPSAFLDEPFPRIPRWLMWVGGFFVVYLITLTAGYAIADVRGMTVVNSLVYGWLSFFLRRLGMVQPDWSSLLMGLLAFIALMIVVHTLGHRAAMGLGDAGRWTGRSTLAVTASVLVLFAGGVAMVGAAHQALWLSSGVKSSSANSIAPAWIEPTGPLDFVGSARMAARRSMSRYNLKEMILSIDNYQSNFDSFPIGAVVDSHGHAVHGWVFNLSYYGRFYAPTEWQKEPWDGPQNQKYARGALLELVNPQLGWHGQFDEHGYAYMHYAANVHGFPNNRGLKISEITDGTSNTLAIGEVAENFQPWASPWNRRDPADGINDVPWGFGGPPSQNGALFAFFDGQVRMISRNVDRDLLKSLGLPNDGKPVDEWESKLR